MPVILRDVLAFLCFGFLASFLANHVGKASSLKIQKREITNCDGSKLIVDKHNDLRRNEGASDMKQVKWSVKLASMAESYALKCIWAHGDLESNDLPYKEVGQNLYTSQGERIRFDYVIDKWFQEKIYFNFATKTCAEGKLCGHYTQIVWSNTSEIGCAHRICDKLVTPNGTSYVDADYVVCYYGPSGNYRELPIYAKGTSCSRCPEGYEICVDGLCSSGPGYGDLDVTFCSKCSNNFTSGFLFVLVSLEVLRTLNFEL